MGRVGPIHKLGPRVWGNDRPCRAGLEIFRFCPWPTGRAHASCGLGPCFMHVFFCIFDNFRLKKAKERGVQPTGHLGGDAVGINGGKQAQFSNQEHTDLQAINL